MLPWKCEGESVNVRRLDKTLVSLTVDRIFWLPPIFSTLGFVC
jgi:hypothetical protein